MYQESKINSKGHIKSEFKPEYGYDTQSIHYVMAKVQNQHLLGSHSDQLSWKITENSGD